MKFKKEEAVGLYYSCLLIGTNYFLKEPPRSIRKIILHMINNKLVYKLYKHTENSYNKN